LKPAHAEKIHFVAVPGPNHAQRCPRTQDLVLEARDLNLNFTTSKPVDDPYPGREFEEYKESKQPALKPNRLTSGSNPSGANQFN
jgi:hypothetical protein